MRALDLDRFQSIAASRREAFAAAAPFPHMVLDDFLHPDAAEAMLREFDDLPDAWTYYHHLNERKRGFSDVSRMGPASRAVIADLQSDGFVRALEVLSGVDRLVSDPQLDGAGLHETPPGGFLNVHHDFLSHTTNPHWSRQLNLLLFLNKDWDDTYKGWLELWDAEVRRPLQRIAPHFNRCVIFRTGRRSFHGVPAGVACPPGRRRRSLALYYFRDEGRHCDLGPTHYVPLPGDTGMRRALIRLDRWALYIYSAFKRYTPLGDRLVTRLLRHF